MGVAGAEGLGRGGVALGGVSDGLGLGGGGEELGKVWRVDNVDHSNHRDNKYTMAII